MRRRFGWMLAAWLGAPLHGGGTPLTVEQVATVTDPTFITHAPGDADRLFVTGRFGEVVIVDNGTQLAQPFLDISGLVDTANNEQGLLGLAFHPGYAVKGLFYVYYTRLSDDAIVLARYQVTADPDVADPGSGLVIVTMPQVNPKENGGWMDFGSDGYLYAGVGQGGPGASTSQDLESLLGKLLRLDVNGDDFPGDPNLNYAIPPDNPLVGIAGADEIWAWGLRNPWRCAFDPATGELYIADVGAGAREELNVQPAGSTGGENYGWRCREGTTCTGHDDCDCLDPSLVDPLFEYENPPDLPAAVIGGYVYRGCAIPDLLGAYVFADHWLNSGGRIWKLRHDGAGNVTQLEEIQDELQTGGTIQRVTTFGVDAAGELYLGDFAGDEVFRIVAADGTPGACCPWDLDGDGVVGVNDFLDLLAAWGTDPGGPPDFDGNGDVGITDFLELLAAWGPCEGRAEAD